MQRLTVLGICGSSRSGSLNRSALRLAGECMPTDMSLIEAPDGPIGRLQDAIAGMDGVLIASPEHYFSIPHELRALINSVGRGNDQPFAVKPVALISASEGMLGGARIQHELRKCLKSVGALVMQKPEVYVGLAHTKFSQQGICTDAATRALIVGQMAAFHEWITGVQRMRDVAVA